ncbi:MAG TPA: DUF5631 domain-containing protein [Mycobacterium sp.]|uniref:DUF5631 domain-containing protein n=1 Tax=Mycobacterium sp. TaxID=1785 RepID=UPI002F3F06B3
MMQVGGGLGGEWSALIVGHQWPSDTTIAGLNAWIENRGQIAEAHHNIADLLNSAKTGPLAVQEGKTADSLVQLFDEGEQLAREVANKNGVKKESYATALSSVQDLRGKLSDIAQRYNEEIRKILESKEPAAAKVPEILAAIGRGQQEANLAAANCGGDIGDAGQRILDQEATSPSFRQFAKTNGIDMSQLFRSRDTNGLEPTVQGMLTTQGTADGGASGAALGVNPAVSSLPGGAAGGGAVPGVNPAVSSLPGGAAPGVNPAVSSLPAYGASSGTSAAVNPSSPGSLARPAGYMTTTPGLAPPPAPPGSPGPSAPPGVPPTTSPGVAPVAQGNATNPVAAPAPNQSPVVQGFGSNPTPPPPVPQALPVVQGSGPNTPPGLSATATSGAISPPAPMSMFNPAYGGFQGGPPSGALNAAGFQGIAPPSMVPAEFPHHLEAGLMPPGAGGIPPTPPIAPQVPPTPVSPTTAPTAGSGDWHSAIPAEQPSTPQASSPSYSSQAASPSTSMSSPTNPGYMSSTTAPSTSYTGGPLPTYGSDLRPPAASVPAGSPSLPPPAASNPPPGPSSPSTNPAAGSGGSVAQTGVVRSDSATASSQQPAPMGLAGKAVGASAVGAVAGAASADATARIRLQRIVDAVARQESRLAWAAGDRPDDTTVLITDLADGWIPPGVEIPSVVTLLEPRRRRGDLEALLGEVKTAVMHTPDRYVPEEDESVPTSPRPRHAPEIEELGWELSSATHWRDGLPRLAHTLAKAASSGTGVDPSEVELLQQQMHNVGERVLDAYPDEIDPKHLGNWQLLAAIEALIRGDRVGANYHLAWFQACMTSTTGPQL